jgi:hypothetical protein
MPEAEMFNDMMRHRFGMTTTRSDIPPHPTHPRTASSTSSSGLFRLATPSPSSL